MNGNRIRITGVAVVALLASLVQPGLARGAETAVAPTRLADMLAPCASCHGSDGASSQPDVPHLDRQDIPYLIESLELLAAGRRPTKVALHIPADWSAEDRRAVAHFFNGKTPARATETFDPEKARIGREIFLERCESCHEDGGREPDYRGAGSARIAGQRMAYLEVQLKAYLAGQRPFLVGVKKQSFLGLPITIRGGQARERLDPIGSGEVESIVHFLASNQIESARPSGRRSRR